MIAIEFQGVSKKYQRCSARPQATTLKSYLLHDLWWRRENHRDFLWALRDMDLTVEKGMTLGVIGRNGSGKSTFLKLATRILKPDTGTIVVRGKVVALIELGVGFHPELSGRENIVINGIIMGLTRSEIKARLDEIVDFSGVEKYIDTPVKRYSSGMYVRLAFAVAAHLDPEILIIDEVLAVGDFEFQKKCLGKMGEVAKEGRTVLFVSHNMQAVATLCHNALLLVDGKIVKRGKNEGIGRIRN